MSDEPKNPAYRNVRAEKWREVAQLLRHALGDAYRQLREHGIEPATSITDALVVSFLRNTRAYGPSYAVKPQPIHTCDYDSSGFCRVCDLPQP